MSVNVSCCVGVRVGAHWYLLTGPPPASTTAAMASLAPVSDSGYNCAALPVPVSNACLKVRCAVGAGVDAQANGNGSHFKLVSHAAVFAFLFGQALRENAAYSNEMKCNLHLNALTKTHTHSHAHRHTHRHTLTHSQLLQKASEKSPKGTWPSRSVRARIVRVCVRDVRV